MKNYLNSIKFLLFTTLFASVLFSCSKEESLQIEDAVAQIPLADPGEIVDLVKLNGKVAEFESIEDFYEFTSSLSTLDESQLAEITSLVDFTTIEDYYDYLYAELDKIEDTQEFRDFIAAHSDYLEININDEDEEEVVEKELSVDPTSIIQNSDRIIKVGDTYLKYLGEYAIKSTDYERLLSISSIAEVKSADLEYARAYTILDQSTGKGGQEQRWDDLNVKNSLIAVKNKRWCRNDRRVRLSWNIIDDNFEFEVPNASGKDDKFKVTNIFVITQIRPSKKGIPCIWYNYKTRITRNNFLFNGDVRFTNSTVQESFNITKPNTSVEARRLDTRDFVLGLMPRGDQKPEARWTRERVSVTTRGMDGQWIHLNQ